MGYFADKKRFVEEKERGKIFFKKNQCMIYNEIYIGGYFGAANCCPLSLLTSFGGLFSVD